MDIQNIGHYCPTDADGFIEKDADLSKIDDRYLPVIEEVKKVYISHLGSEIHSLYIRGSVPRELGIPQVSDLDTIAITTRPVEELDLAWKTAEGQRLKEKFPFVTGVEFGFYQLDDILKRLDHFSMIPFILKTHSVCIHGEDITKGLPSYRADKSLGNEHLFHLKTEIGTAKEDLVNNEGPEDILDCCSWIMKKIVRAGLALVIEEEHLYTRDLYPAYRLFAEHFPKKESEMKQALVYAISPIEDIDELISFLSSFGAWMAGEADGWLRIHNPHKLENLRLYQKEDV
ncbi:nucleotidyltransferase [Radiobacillus kanasensis]|uniref:nucleotidyltransferase n=1 Tax=Radiobacillus kanasensis TaxID=2844358 RepID=UPI001E3ADCE3|nr:nucleotidyltransferase [Radiobacillus kanasensis]UFT99245.1 nucleotidyltransferase [Radiobacillus kanasensis]